MNGYVELGYLVVLGSLAVYSVSLATRHRRAAQTVRVVEAARLVAAAGAGNGAADAVSPGGHALAAAVPEAPTAGEVSARPGAAPLPSDPRSGSDLSPPTPQPSTAAPVEGE